MIQLKKIVVPTDNSECSVKAIAYALEIAKLQKAQVHLVNVVDDRFMAYMSLGDNISSDAPHLEEKMIELMEKEMAESIQDLDISKTDIVKKIIVGHPSDEICAYSHEIEADMIIMGTHGRTGISRILIGSVAERVVRQAHRSVLVVKPDDIHDEE